MKILVFLVFFLGLSACGGGGSRDFGMGYEYVQFDSSNHGIVDSNGRVVVFPEIKSYINNKGYVVGIRCVSKNLIDSDPDFTEGFGYFFVDKTSSEIKLGMDRNQVLVMLRGKGLNDLASQVERNCRTLRVYAMNTIMFPRMPAAESEKILLRKLCGQMAH